MPRSIRSRGAVARDYQKKHIKNIVAGLKKYDRGQAILPCRFGKTVTSLLATEKIKPQMTLVIVPTLALVRQFKSDWVNLKNQNFNYFIVCSDSDLKNDDEDIVGVTTDSKETRGYLKELSSSKERGVVFATYQSLRMVKDATRYMKGFSFDLTIIDEAHRTAGSRYSEFALVHDNKNIRSKKRLYMTATPKIFSSRSKEGGLESYVACMDDEIVFGSVLSQMSFKEAIEKNIISDYRLVYVEVTEEEVFKKISSAKFTKEDDLVADLANIIVMEKLRKKYGVNNILTFHSSIDKAESLERATKAHSKKVNTYTISSRMKTSERAKVLAEFSKDDCALMTNCRVLTEGVTLEKLDCVLLADSMQSEVSVVQAISRALNKKPKGQKAIIAVPVFKPKDQSFEDYLQTTPFKKSLSVIRHMASIDARIAEELSSLKSSNISEMGEDGEVGVISEHIEYLSSSLKISLRAGIRIKEWGLRSFKSMISYKEAQLLLRRVGIVKCSDYKKFQKGHPNLPANPERFYKEWVNWKVFLGTGTGEYLSYEEAQELSMKNGITTKVAYGEFQKKHHNLPSNPNIYYKESWVSWRVYLRGEENVSEFMSYEEAMDFVKKHNIKKVADYKKFQRKYPELPSTPTTTYRDKWVNWKVYLGNGDGKFLSYEEAQSLVQSHGITSSYAYWKFRQSHPKLPSVPTKIYADKWINWNVFLGTGNKFLSLKEAKKLVQENSVTSVIDYQSLRKRHKGLPSAPATTYAEEWVDWYDLFGKKKAS